MSYFSRFPFQYEAKKLYPDDRIKQPEVSGKILDFIIIFIELKKMFPEANAALELETRPGSISFFDKSGREIPDHYCQLTLEKASKNGLTIVNSKMFSEEDIRELEHTRVKSENDRRRLNDIRSFRESLLVSKEVPQKEGKPFFEYVNGVECRFHPEISEEAFFNRLSFFRSGTSTQFVEEKDFDLTLDVKDNSDIESRFTFDIKNNKYLKTTKLLKSNLDLIDRGAAFRTSAAIEVNTDSSVAEFMTKVRLDSANARLKVRWHFEFYHRYDISFTQTFEVKFNNHQKNDKDKHLWDCIVSTIKKKQSDPSIPNSQIAQEIIRVFESSKESKPSYEVECEFKAINQLINSFYEAFDETMPEPDRVMRKNYFTKNVSEFFLNSEIIYSLLTKKKRAQDTDDQDIMHFTEYKKHFKDRKITAIEYPLLGEYLEEVLVRRKRELHRIQQEKPPRLPHHNGDHRKTHEQTPQLREPPAQQSTAESAIDPRKKQPRKSKIVEQVEQENWKKL